MPFYEYRCSVCQHQESFLESIKAPQRKTCPKCGARRKFERLMSSAGFQLKGSGWYVTDFKNKDKKPAAKKDSAGNNDKSDKNDNSDKSSKSDNSDNKKKDKGDSKTEKKAGGNSEKT